MTDTLLNTESNPFKLLSQEYFGSFPALQLNQINERKGVPKNPPTESTEFYETTVVGKHVFFNWDFVHGPDEPSPYITVHIHFNKETHKCFIWFQKEVAKYDWTEMCGSDEDPHEVVNLSIFEVQDLELYLKDPATCLKKYILSNHLNEKEVCFQQHFTAYVEKCDEIHKDIKISL